MKLENVWITYFFRNSSCLEEIYYICSMNEDLRETYHTEEYDEYYACLDAKTQAKFDYVESIIKNQYVVNKKFVKNLEGTEFYEARVSVGTNEHRTILFAIDSHSFIESRRVLFLSSFLKKVPNNIKVRLKMQEEF